VVTLAERVSHGRRHPVAVRPPTQRWDQTSKHGFVSERAARDARRRLIEQVERGEVRHIRKRPSARTGSDGLLGGSHISKPGTWAG
jgi:hypothetical protein